jgi:hypothetical protein
MDRQQVITVLESLANGVDPQTGTSIMYDAFHAADTVRALFAATTSLKAAETTPPSKCRRESAALTSAGTPWSAEEDARLCREFGSGMTTAQIALQHGRTSGAITSRLVKLGRIDPATVKSRDRSARAASPSASTASGAA